MSGMTKTTVNLAALKAARLEASGGSIEVTWDKEVFTVPTEVPLETMTALRAGDIDGAITAMLGAEQGRRFLALPGVSLQDFNALVQALTESVTGAPMGEPPGS